MPPNPALNRTFAGGPSASPRRPVSLIRYMEAMVTVHRLSFDEWKDC